MVSSTKTRISGLTAVPLGLSPMRARAVPLPCWHHICQGPHQVTCPLCQVASCRPIKMLFRGLTAFSMPEIRRGPGHMPLGDVFVPFLLLLRNTGSVITPAAAALHTASTREQVGAHAGSRGPAAGMPHFPLTPSSPCPDAKPPSIPVMSLQALTHMSADLPVLCGSRPSFCACGMVGRAQTLLAWEMTLN